jgi:16S rRNA (cytosine967-C5)-methyltransferase
VNGRELALKALIDFENRGKTLKDFTVKGNNAQSGINMGKAYDYFYGTIKMRKHLDYILDKHLKNKKLRSLPSPIRNVLREGAYGLLFSKDPAHAAVNESVKLARKFGHNGTAGLVNAVLRNLEPVSYPKDRIEYLATFYSFPEFLIRLLIKAYGDETENILKASNLPPVTSIRVNTLKATPDEVLKNLEKEGFRTKKIQGRERNLLTEGKAIRSESFKNGLFQVQGITQTINTEILRPEKGEIILDLCSFPGTKSTGIAEIMNDDGLILSIDKKDMKLLVENAQRLGIKSVHPVIADVRNFSVSAADRVLLDVPCSGTGVMGKRGDLRWNLNMDSLHRLIEIQKNLLVSAAKNVKKGGVLVYSTCSILPQENEEQISWFLDTNPDFKIFECAGYNNPFIKNLPGNPYYDAGFGAVLLRR